MAPPPRKRAAGRYRKPRRKVCTFCVEKATSINYKSVSRIRKFLSERGKIIPKRTSGNCARHQRQLAMAMKRARQIALLPYVAE